ncbi:MAG TPA: hypothetical protein VKP30_21520 [Polyangiaceae bacterium]|nr:hypothetical protein [Polyangiaceae bacterium]
MRRIMAWLCVTWPLGLGLTILWNSSVLFDAVALVRLSNVLDTTAASWLTAAVGYAGLLATASCTKPLRLGPTATTAWSVLAVCFYTLHLFLLRWPWMAGALEPGSRLAQWSGVLSATNWGAPWSAFLELLCIAVLITHARSGVLALASGFSLEIRERVARSSFGVCAWLCLQASSVVIVLATGRR